MGSVRWIGDDVLAFAQLFDPLCPWPSRSRCEETPVT